MFISSKSTVYLLKDGDAVGLSASRSGGLSKWSVLFGHTGFDAMSSIPDQTLSLMWAVSSLKPHLIPLEGAQVEVIMHRV